MLSCSEMKYSSVVFIALLIPTLCIQDRASCKKRYYLDWLKLCPAFNLLELSNWQFSRATLCDELPCIGQRDGFIGVKNGVTYSVVDPVPLNKDVKLIAVADDVLANILDLDPNKASEFSSFVEFSSGNYVLPSSTPMAHRYGGHQV